MRNLHLETGTIGASTYKNHKELSRQKNGSWEHGAIINNLQEQTPRMRYGNEEAQPDNREQLISDILKRLEALEGRIRETPGNSETAQRRRANERASRLGTARALQEAYEMNLRSFQRRR